MLRGKAKREGARCKKGGTYKGGMEGGDKTMGAGKDLRRWSNQATHDRSREGGGASRHHHENKPRENALRVKEDRG